MAFHSPEPPFGDYATLAHVYDRARPSYPEKLVSAIVRRAGIQPGDPVAELGAGTGKLTCMLAERSFSVSAVEPILEMRAIAPVLRGVHWSAGTFESTGLSSQSQSWVVAAQAFHRARLALALPEIHRVLKPGGCFTAIWYAHHIERHPVLLETYAMLRRRVPAYGYRDRTRRRHRWPSRALSVMPKGVQQVLGRMGAFVLGGWRPLGRGLELFSTGHFEALSYDEHRHSEAITADRYLDVWRSRSVLRAIAGCDEFDAFLADLGDYLGKKGITEFPVSYVFGAWSARAR
jgi:ubiquinone/menaquinone biosynthesis C-methylase UbiE